MWHGSQQNRSISLTAITSPLIYSSHHHVHKPETQQPSVRFRILKSSKHNSCLIFINTLDGSCPTVETSQNTALQYLVGTPAVETHPQKQNYTLTFTPKANLHWPDCLFTKSNGVWEEARGSGESPGRHRENARSTLPGSRGAGS